MSAAREPTTAPVERHRIHDADRGSRKVRTWHRCGVYAVHRTPLGNYSIDHLPTGNALGPLLPTLAIAVRACELWHREAPGAGAGLSMGANPTGETVDVMRHAAEVVATEVARG